MGMKLSGKTVLITGASSGLGRGVAEALGGRGNRLILTARREALLDEVAEGVRADGSECLVVPADATDSAACKAVIDAGIEAFGPIDVALLNAGGGQAAPMGSTSCDDVTWMMRVNYDTLANFLMPLIIHMKGRPTTIAHTSSPAGYFGLPKAGPYSAAKAAGRTLFDTARLEVSGSGTTFVGLYPGFTATPGLAEDEVPVKALIIPTERAVREMIRAMERGKAHHMFPRRIAWLMGLARALPEPVRRVVLSRAG